MSCASAGNVVSCASPAPLPAQTATVTLTVAVATAAVPQVTNVATVSTPGDAIASNNRAVDPTDVGDRGRGDRQDAHQASSSDWDVHAAGQRQPAITTGAITVTDTLPAGLTFASGTGGWMLGEVRSSCSNLGRSIPTQPDRPWRGIGVAAMPSGYKARVAALGDTASGGNNVSTDGATVTGDFRLAAEKRASRTEVEIGDVLDYAVSIRTMGESPVPGLTVSDRLPPGFAYVAGSARVAGARIPDPTGGAGPQLLFAAGLLPADSQLTLTYRVKVGAGAQMGTSVSSAQGVQRHRCAVEHRIGAGAGGGRRLLDRGVIVGKVFMSAGAAPIECRERRKSAFRVASIWKTAPRRSRRGR
jgi:uncharacterized repeat protein (TIGR01451 family)